MIVELPVRWTTQVLDEESAEEQYIKSLKGDRFGSPVKTKHENGYIVLNFSDIRGFHSYGKRREFTVVRVVPADSYCVRIPYEDFKALYQKMTNETITVIPAGQDPLAQTFKDLNIDLS